MEKYDIAIIGGGLLGTCISYWISNLYDAKVIVIEKESDVGMHTSSRNTGVVHSPFYLDPNKKAKLAKAAFLSHEMWKKFAEQKNLSWKMVGTMEIALDESQNKILEKYMEWGPRNGMSEENIKLLSGSEVSKQEPNIQCHSAIHCKTDAIVDFGVFTRELKKESQRKGTKFLFDRKLESVENLNDSPTLTFHNKEKIISNHVINCAGGYSLNIAKQFGLANNYSSLHFRGEYWIASPQYANLVKTNVYSVPKYPDFPFLDPHWILRADGRTEVGPNAVPVPSPETYSGYVGNIETFISKLTEVVTGSTRKLLLNADFMNLVAKEWLSSISKTIMIERIQEFLPMVKPEFFSERGTSGIRTPIITPQGKFLPDLLEIEGPNSFHILNYNSPGATGTPAYAGYVVKSLQEKGFLQYGTRKSDSIWEYNLIT